MEVNHVLDLMESIHTCLGQSIPTEGLMELLSGDEIRPPRIPKCHFIPF